MRKFSGDYRRIKHLENYKLISSALDKIMFNHQNKKDIDEDLLG